MAVYVDNARNAYRGMKMCHMVADRLAELIAMADAIGLPRRHFQAFSHPHFDLSQSYRARAIAKGAIAVDKHDLVAAMRRHRDLWRSCPGERAAIAAADRASDKGRGRRRAPRPRTAR